MRKQIDPHTYREAKIVLLTDGASSLIVAFLTTLYVWDKGFNFMESMLMVIGALFVIDMLFMAFVRKPIQREWIKRHMEEYHPDDLK